MNTRRNFFSTLLGGFAATPFVSASKCDYCGRYSIGSVCDGCGNARLVPTRVDEGGEFLVINTPSCKLPRGLKHQDASHELAGQFTNMLLSLEARFNSVRAEWIQGYTPDYGHFRIEVNRSLLSNPYWFDCYG